MQKGDRAKWLEKKLDSYGMPSYGRASAISRDLGCSNAVAQGWLNGSLAKDMELGLRFADKYKFTLRQWVTGEDPASDLRPKAMYAIRMAREFEEEFGALSIDQFMLVVELIGNAGQGANLFADNLSAIAKIIKN
jgi:hypothetical protein